MKPIVPVLTAPCSGCPFRTDRPVFLRLSRVEEICSALLAGNSFTCHKTLSASGRVVSKSKMCGGAAVMLHRMRRPNQIMQIAQRLGFLNENDLDRHAPVYRSAAAMIRRHRRMQ